MMDIRFTKYHGTGNDFILIDDRDETFDIQATELIEKMCSRRFGVGADGLILLRTIDGYDFQMVYFNSDGNQSTMCGNGGRCLVHFAHSLGLFSEKCVFLAVDGPHQAEMKMNDIVKLKMSSVDEIISDDSAYVLDTGSPHYVLKVEDVAKIDVKMEGSKIRYSKLYHSKGINVNFVEYKEGGAIVATYERGVENETYSCGTGVTASALIINKVSPERYPSPIHIETKGGNLSVYFTAGINNSYSNIWLEGPAVKTFDGVWSV